MQPKCALFTGSEQQWGPLMLHEADLSIVDLHAPDNSQVTRLKFGRCIWWQE